MQTETININPLPIKTWNHLKINDIPVDIPDTLLQYEYEKEHRELPDGFFREIIARDLYFDSIESGMGDDIDKLLDPIRSEHLIGEGSGGDAVYLPYHFASGVAVASEEYFTAKAGSDRIYVMDFTTSNDTTQVESDITDHSKAGDGIVMHSSTDDTMSVEKAGRGLALVSTKIHIEKRARVRLVQIHRTSDDVTVLSNIGAHCEDDARFELIQIYISGDSVYSGVATELTGDRSSLLINTGYITHEGKQLDLNYIARHRGAHTTSDINVSGTLKNGAIKRFRGTIDFKRGSTGAKGDEIENVLLLGDDVVNKTIPVILCEEEDVEGNHGATIGKLDDETMRYMLSRGLDEDVIMRMMESAYVESVCRMIPDDKYSDMLIS